MINNQNTRLKSQYNKFNLFLFIYKKGHSLLINTCKMNKIILFISYCVRLSSGCTLFKLIKKMVKIQFYKTAVMIDLVLSLDNNQ